jgi:hypothetical protein
MPVTLPDDFPLLLSDARQPDRIRAAIDLFRDGLAAGGIRNVDYQDAKSRLGRALDQAWERHVSASFFHAGRWETQPEPVRALSHACNPSSLHDLLAVAKRLAASDATGPAVDAMRALTAEVLPLAEAARQLKGLVVKGRVPVPPRPVNPDQIRGTCSCCFRDTAIIETGRMAHHGYERPGDGVQSPSCAGVRFPPLEVSTEGLEWLVWSTSEKLGADRERLERRDEMNSITYQAHDKGRLVPKTITRGEEGWDRVLRAWTRMMEHAIQSGERRLDHLEGELETWRARHAPTKPDEDGPSP